MEYWRPKICYLVLLLLVVVLILSLSNDSNWVNGVQQVPCYFIFGDSLYDNGNNNNLPTRARANYLPYGIDLPGGPTGRFSNGRNLPDVITQLLGFDNFIPPFATASGQEILKGVNYASGGAGIREETGRNNLGVVISLNGQLQNHKTTVSRIASILGDQESATQHLSKCLYTVGFGSNDYINNYLLPQFYPTSRQYPPDQYATVLIQQYSQKLKTLHNYGAKKIALFGIGPLGCAPGPVAMYGTNGSACVDYINKAIQLFNTNLKTLVDDLNNQFRDAKFIYINTYDLLFADASVGIQDDLVTTIIGPCCPVANLPMNNGILTCIPFSTSCSNRYANIFWDGVHPSETVNVITGGRAYIALNPTDTYPIDIRRLIQLPFL